MAESSFTENVSRPRNSTFKREMLLAGNIENEIFLKSYTPDSKYSFNNFVIHTDQQIGSGAFSVICKCTNKIDKKTYAVKIINKPTLVDITPDIIYNEISIHERIIHPHIIRMYSHYEDDSNIYCFLEIVNGVSLYQKSRGGLSEKGAHQIFSQAIKSIKFCHDNNIIHRDVKLENFLYDPITQIVKLCDFGWATELGSDQMLRATICGTYDYMAPEMIQQQAYDYSVDIWALGVLLYELIHGYTPFGSGEDDYAMIFKNVLKFNFKIDKEITNNCRDLLMKMLNLKPDSRVTINDIVKHPWFDDWNEEKNKEKEKKEGDNEDKMFYDVLKKVEKKNKIKKGKKNAQDGQKSKKVAYSKNSEANRKRPKNEVKEEQDDSLLMKSTMASNGKTTSDAFGKREDMHEISSKPVITNQKINSNLLNGSSLNKTKTQNQMIKLEEKKEETFNNPMDMTDQTTNSKYSNLSLLSSNKSSNEYSTNHLMSMLNEDRYMEKENEKTYNNNIIKSKKISQPEQMKYNKNNFQNINSFNQNNYYNQKKNTLNDEDELTSALNMFEKADKLKSQNNRKIGREEEGFWGKMLSAFKCGANNNTEDN